MFTGLIEDVGIIKGITKGNQSTTFTIQTLIPHSRFRIGDSVAVNGACLTLVGLSSGRLDVTAVLETMEVTTLGRLAVGSRVNLERPLRVGDPLDGHLVLGHVDGQGKLLTIRRQGDSYRLTVSCDESLMALIVSKGSVAVDGISLTVAELESRSFGVAVIPHTWENTTLRDRREGDVLNLEMDILGKYVMKMLCNRTGDWPRPEGESRLSAEFLSKHGFR